MAKTNKCKAGLSFECSTLYRDTSKCLFAEPDPNPNKPICIFRCFGACTNPEAMLAARDKLVTKLTKKKK